MRGTRSAAIAKDAIRSSISKGRSMSVNIVFALRGFSWFCQIRPSGMISCALSTLEMGIELTSCALTQACLSFRCNLTFRFDGCWRERERQRGSTERQNGQQDEEEP